MASASRCWPLLNPSLRKPCVKRVKRWLWLWLAILPGWAQPVHMVTRSQWGSQPQALSEELRHTPQRIALHHSGVLWKSGDDAGKKIRALQSWGQREKNWPDLPYHFLIDPQGIVFEGRDLNYRPESNTQYELDGVINVELWGNFDEQLVTRQQLGATIELLAWLRDRYGLKEVQTHRQLAPGQTRCPGDDLMRYLDSGMLQKWVDQCHDGEVPAVEVLPVSVEKP